MCSNSLVWLGLLHLPRLLWRARGRGRALIPPYSPRVCVREGSNSHSPPPSTGLTCVRGRVSLFRLLLSWVACLPLPPPSRVCVREGSIAHPPFLTRACGCERISGTLTSARESCEWPPQHRPVFFAIPSPAPGGREVERR